MELTQDELERELVVYDKQKLITECLKLFKYNKHLSKELTESRLQLTYHKTCLSNANMEIVRLKKRTVWQVINERLSEAIRVKREKRIAAGLTKVGFKKTSNEA